MDGENLDNWFGSVSMKDGRPPDLGYYMGSKICESYYSNASDKKRAIQDIFKIDDFSDFLNRSGYAEKFPG